MKEGGDEKWAAGSRRVQDADRKLRGKKGRKGDSDNRRAEQRDKPEKEGKKVGDDKRRKENAQGLKETRDWRGPRSSDSGSRTSQKRFKDTEGKRRNSLRKRDRSSKL